LLAGEGAGMRSRTFASGCDKRNNVWLSIPRTSDMRCSNDSDGRRRSFSITQIYAGCTPSLRASSFWLMPKACRCSLTSRPNVSRASTGSPPFRLLLDISLSISTVSQSASASVEQFQGRYAQCACTSHAATHEWI
jgi:hypothetical protein